MSKDFKAGFKRELEADGKKFSYYDIRKFAEENGRDIQKIPYSIRVLVENMLRNIDGRLVSEEDARNVLNWAPSQKVRSEIPYMPSRVVMQDFTGVPGVVDLASMREAVKTAGGDPQKINPQVETALVVDHSVQVDHFGEIDSLQKNIEIEYSRNSERYLLLKWSQKTFDNFMVVPPGMGIIHQVNLEYLAKVVMERDGLLYPDTLVGTDSHTTMINGIGVMGWGVGGIEAEAVMLGQPYYMVLPDVIGVRLTGTLKEGVTATDLVLTITEMLRKRGVVGKFVEFFGAGVEELSLPNRATIANMAPEYGATMGFFPVDKETVRYLRQSGRPDELIERVEQYCRAQRLFVEDYNAVPEYTDVLELDMESVDSSLAGPKRPQDRVLLRKLKTSFKDVLVKPVSEGGFEVSDPEKRVSLNGSGSELGHGAVVIAAITSCTNTSNPSVMLGAGLLAKKAVEKGLEVKPFVKTSLAPGSQVVTEYLEKSGLLPYLEKLRFNVVGYGCTTCIGNSGPLPDPIRKAVTENDLVAAAVISGNRNFEGRVNPHVKANYLASPVHVVAFALAGRVGFDPDNDSLGQDKAGNPVFLKDIWPTNAEIQELVDRLVTPDVFRDRYASVFEGTSSWRELDVEESEYYQWDSESTYIQNPPFFEGFSLEPGDVSDIEGARVLALLGDSVTTDHISPAGAIPSDSPAARYLREHGVEVKDFNSFGSRRGNHEVMMRGTFGNVRLRNLLLDNVEGGFTIHLPDGEQMSIFAAAMKYKEENVPLIVIGGKEYGTGSSRDWAAKGTALLGVCAVIAESFERIHRGNLVGMGVLPLEFIDGQSRESLALTGRERFSIRGISAGLEPRQEITVEVLDDSGTLVKTFKTRSRLDTKVDVDYFVNGGILQTVLRNLLKS